MKCESHNLLLCRLRSVETAIGLMKNLQTSIVVEETWVEKQTEKLQALPTATSARELDVSTPFPAFIPVLVSLLSGFIEHKKLAIVTGSLVG